MEKRKVLFLCTHNSARSQMAESILMNVLGGMYEAHSAGTEPTEVNPFTFSVLKEAGIDTEGLWAKSVDEFVGERFDLVVTVCDNARENCPFFPGAKRYVHQGFTDPAKYISEGMAPIEAFRKVRDEIGIWVRWFFSERP